MGAGSFRWVLEVDAGPLRHVAALRLRSDRQWRAHHVRGPLQAKEIAVACPPLRAMDTLISNACAVAVASVS
jgi:hypothetical protein